MTAAKRVLYALGVAALAVLAFSIAPVSSDAVPDCARSCPSLAVDTTTPVAGGAFRVTGSGYGAYHAVTLELHPHRYPLGTAGTDDAGSFQATVRLPDGVTGRHTILATDRATKDTARQVIRIAGGRRGSGTDGGASPAYTRVALIGLGAVGVVLFIGGGLLLVAGRRRHLSI
jgi:hypothetical protein